MRWTEALQGVRMAVFLNLLHRWESAELNQEEAAERADVPSLDAAGSRRPGRGGGAALSRALPRLHGQALPRASGERSRPRLMATPRPSCTCSGWGWKCMTEKPW